MVHRHFAYTRTSFFPVERYPANHFTSEVKYDCAVRLLFTSKQRDLLTPAHMFDSIVRNAKLRDLIDWFQPGGNMEISRRMHVQPHRLPAVVEQHSQFQTSQQTFQGRDKALIRQITHSPTFRRYREAFSNATGLPLSLQSKGDFALAHAGTRRQSPFCALLEAHNSTCADSLRFQSALQQKASAMSVTVRSRFGLNETAVPVKLGDRVVGYLHTGQVFFRRPTTRDKHRAFKQLRELGVGVSSWEFRRAYEATPVLQRCAYNGIVRLLEYFARQIAAFANRVLLEQSTPLPSHIVRARQFICEHYGEPLNLSNVARHLGISRFTLCKGFSHAMGVTFKDYVSRFRIEKAKALLVNSRCHVSEAAYSCGFNSLSNFNRHFHRIVGQSPTSFRRRINS